MRNVPPLQHLTAYSTGPLHFLHYALKSLYRKRPTCTNCGLQALEFWDHGSGLVVFQCKHCRYNHTMSAFHHREVLLILENLPGLYVILTRLKRQSDDLLGYHLWEQCEVVEWYCRRSLRRHPGI